MGVHGVEHRYEAAGARSVRLLVVLVAAIAIAGCKEKPPRPAITGPAPDSFTVVFETSRGRFVVAVTRVLAPRGVDRLRELLNDQYFDDDRFFRVIPGFVAQFGASDDKKLNEKWDDKAILDDSVRTSNARGTLVFALDGPNSRTHQLFINLADNPRLDTQGFAPVGKVVEGMSVVDSIYGGYGDTPSYHLIATLGNSYLRRMFPKLDWIKTARVVAAGGSGG